MPPVLHFGYFDHGELVKGRLRRSREPVVDRLASTLDELFGPLPGRDMPGLGFFDHYGVLSCQCASVFGSIRYPVDRIAELVDRSDCDVAYAYNGEYWLVSRASLRDYLDPVRIPLPEISPTET
jgi:hypothetical protein